MRTALTIVAMLAVLCDPMAHAQDNERRVDLPHIDVDFEARTVTFDATVVLRDSDWIELLVCTPMTREHESILRSEARPSHVHLALLLVDAEPGNPMSWHRDGEDGMKVEPPTGRRIAVSLAYERDGEERVVAANEWIRNQKDGALLEESTWLFTGSGFIENEGRRIYRADVGGSMITVVNFGDDMLARPTTMTNHTDDATWAANTEAIPPLETPVRVRLQVMDDKPEDGSD